MLLSRNFYLLVVSSIAKFVKPTDISEEINLNNTQESFVLDTYENVFLECTTQLDLSDEIKFKSTEITSKNLYVYAFLKTSECNITKNKTFKIGKGAIRFFFCVDPTMDDIDLNLNPWSKGIKNLGMLRNSEDIESNILEIEDRENISFSNNGLFDLTFNDNYKIPGFMNSNLLKILNRRPNKIMEEDWVREEKCDTFEIRLRALLHASNSSDGCTNIIGICSGTFITVFITSTNFQIPPLQIKALLLPNNDSIRYKFLYEFFDDSNASWKESQEVKISKEIPFYQDLWFYGCIGLTALIIILLLILWWVWPRKPEIR